MCCEDAYTASCLEYTLYRIVHHLPYTMKYVYTRMRYTRNVTCRDLHDCIRGWITKRCSLPHSAKLVYAHHVEKHILIVRVTMLTAG